jgi:hypothetical protein
MDQAAGTAARFTGRKDAAPPGYDQVARKEKILAARPYAQAWRTGMTWYGAHPVGRWTWVTGPRNGLRQVLDAIERIAGLDDALRAAEAAHPGWHVYLCPTGTWHAWRGEAAHVKEPTVARMEAAIAAVEAIVTWPELAAS